MSYDEIYLLALSGITLISVATIIFTVSKVSKCSFKFSKKNK